jgi:hypothetical protein
MRRGSGIAGCFQPGLFMGERVQSRGQVSRSKPAQHLVQPDQGGIHEPFARPNRYRGNTRVGAVSSLGDRFDRWEIEMMPVAIAKEEKLPDPGPFLQTDRVLTEELA